MKSQTSLLFFFLLLVTFVSCQKDQIIGNTPPVVVAGKDTTIQLTAATGDTINLIGTATDKESTVVGYLWSQIAGPNTPVITTAGSKSTSVVGVIGGTYVFQLMATDPEGATGVKTLKVTVLERPITNLTLKPASNPFEVSLGVWNSKDYTNNSSPELSGCAWTRDGLPVTLRGLFKFDLSSVPANAKIISAKLSLYSNPTPKNGNFMDANFGANNALLLQRVTEGWNTTVTWPVQPSTTATNQILIPHTPQSNLDLIDLDVTALVKDMSGNSNHGFMIRLQDETYYTSRIFCSSRYSNSAMHPRLVVQYK